MEAETVGIDLAKNVFQIHGVDCDGITVVRKRVRRANFRPFMANLPACTVGIEACASAFYWARQLEAQGHTVRIISPQFVKPFVRGNKNDGNDAEAICEAMQRPNMRYVPLKSVYQQDVQSLHRARQGLVSHRTAVVSQIRAMLLDRGHAIGVGIHKARKAIPGILEDADNELSGLIRETLFELWELLINLDERIDRLDKRIDEVFRDSQQCQRIGKIEGVGPKIATAMIAAVGNGTDFRNGRHMAAWLGLVPKHRASGDSLRMGRISKHGNQELRTLLVHGARSVVWAAARKTDPKSRWINSLVERRGMNRAIVAVANKNARIIWAVLAKEQEYRAAA